MSHTAHVGIRPAWIYLLQLRYSNFQAHRFIFKKDSQQQRMSTSLLPWMKRIVVTSALGAHSRGTELLFLHWSPPFKKQSYSLYIQRVKLQFPLCLLHCFPLRLLYSCVVEWKSKDCNKGLKYYFTSVHLSVKAEKPGNMSVTTSNKAIPLKNKYK